MTARVRLALVRACRTKPIPVNLHDTASNAGLRRCLRLRDVVGFGVGVTVGAGIFVATGEAAAQAGTGVALSFLLAAFGCGCSGLCYAEMSTVAPTAGSAYSFSYNGIGEWAACIVGLMNIAGNILSAAAVARGWASYLWLLLLEIGLDVPRGLAALDLGPFMASPAAFFLVVFLGCVNLMGTSVTAKMNGCITAVSVLLLLAFIAGSIPAVDTVRWWPLLPRGVGGVFRAAGTVFFAYLGFDILACLSDEVEDPQVIPRGIVLTLFLSTFLYAATALVFTGLVTGDEIDVRAPLAAAARLRGLDALSSLVAVGAVGNTMTTVVGSMLGVPRVMYAMSQDGLLPPALGRLNKQGTPVCALLVTLVPTSVCAALFEFGVLAEVVSAGALCSFSFVCVTVVLLRLRAPADPEEAGDAEQAVDAEKADAKEQGKDEDCAPGMANDFTVASNGGPPAPLPPPPQGRTQAARFAQERAPPATRVDTQAGDIGVHMPTPVVLGRECGRYEGQGSNGPMPSMDGGDEGGLLQNGGAKVAALSGVAFGVARDRDRGSVGEGETLVAEFNDNVEAPPRWIGRYLGAYMALCLAAGLLLRPARYEADAGVAHLRDAAAALALLGATATATPIVWAFCGQRTKRRSRPGSGKACAKDSAHVFRVPFMPLLPLIGILMNMALLAQLPAEALEPTLVVVVSCTSFYFFYAAPRSHLEDPAGRAHLASSCE